MRSVWLGHHLVLLLELFRARTVDELSLAAIRWRLHPSTENLRGNLVLEPHLRMVTALTLEILSLARSCGSSES